VGKWTVVRVHSLNVCFLHVASLLHMFHYSECRCYGPHECAAATDSHMDLNLDRDSNEIGIKRDTGKHHIDYMGFKQKIAGEIFTTHETNRRSMTYKEHPGSVSGFKGSCQRYNANLRCPAISILGIVGDTYEQRLEDHGR
jgi:hypothetical protein